MAIFKLDAAQEIKIIIVDDDDNDNDNNNNNDDDDDGDDDDDDDFNSDGDRGSNRGNGVSGGARSICEITLLIRHDISARRQPTVKKI